MAIDPSGGHPAMDYPEHLRTYSGFLQGDRDPDRRSWWRCWLFLLTLVP